MAAAWHEETDNLQSLGFSDLEAAVYTFLLRESPATGYRIAQSIGKPVANTYKAVQALQDRGAVLVDEGESRLCRPVPPRELFAQMQSALRGKCERVAATLERLHTAAEDERVYRLRTREQVQERARQMLRRCAHLALVAAFPEPLEAIRSEVEAAAARGVGVLLKAYHPVDVAGARIVLSNEASLILESLPGQELNLVVDAQEHLLSLLAWQGAGVIQAVWSESPFLSYLHANALYAEWDLTRLNGLLRTNPASHVLQPGLLHRDYPLTETPGFRKLILAGARDAVPAD